MSITSPVPAPHPSRRAAFSNACVLLLALNAAPALAADKNRDWTDMAVQMEELHTPEGIVRLGPTLTPRGLQPQTAARDRFHGALDILPTMLRIERPLQQAALAWDIDRDLLIAMITVESRFRNRAVSPKGAVGLMQLMPETARRFGVRSAENSPMQNRLMDSATNVHAGARYMRYLLDMFDGDVVLALAAYNAGEGAVRKAGRKVPNYPETQNYVGRVLAIYDQRRRISEFDEFRRQPKGLDPAVAPPLLSTTKPPGQHSPENEATLVAASVE